MSMDAAEFDSLLRAAQGGGEWAWSRLYRWLAPSVRGYLRAKGSDAPDDRLGDVFVQVARHIHSFDGDAKGFRSWVFVIAHRKLIDERRKTSRDRSVVTDPADLLNVVAAESVESAVLAARSAQEIRAALALHLTDEQQTVLLLRVFGDMEPMEIAEALGKRPGTIRVIHHRAVKALRKVAHQLGVTL